MHVLSFLKNLVRDYCAETGFRYNLEPSCPVLEIKVPQWFISEVHEMFEEQRKSQKVLINEPEEKEEKLNLNVVRPLKMRLNMIADISFVLTQDMDEYFKIKTNDT